MITSLHIPFSGKTWQVPHFFHDLPSPLLVFSCPAWYHQLFSRVCSGQGACLCNCPIRTVMPLWRLRENESSIIIQEASVLNFSRRSPLYIIISKGKLIYCKLSPFPFVYGPNSSSWGGWRTWGHGPRLDRGPKYPWLESVKLDLSDSIRLLDLKWFPLLASPQDTFSGCATSAASFGSSVTLQEVSGQRQIWCLAASAQAASPHPEWQLACRHCWHTITSSCVSRRISAGIY